MRFYNLDDDPMTGKEILLEPGEIFTFKIKADCKTGKFLRCSAPENCTITGRFEGVGSFVDLAVLGVDTSAFNNQVKTFDVRVTAEDMMSALEAVVFEVRS